MAEIARCYPPGGLIVCTDQHPKSNTVDPGFPNRIVRLPTTGRRLGNVVALTRSALLTAALARQTAASFVWCGKYSFSAYAARWTRLRTGTPYGIIAHGGEMLLLRRRLEQSVPKRWAYRVLLGAAAALVANSRWTANLTSEVLAELGIPNAPNRVRVVPLGTDPDRFRPGLETAEVRARYGLAAGRWLVTVARLVPHKGIDTAIRALAGLYDSIPDLRYLVVGSGPDQVQLQALARTLGVADRVRFLTGVPDEDLPALYNVGTIYLGLSRRSPLAVEGFGISLVEASACRLPVIGGRSGGVPEAVREGETGLLVDPADPREAADAVRLLLDTPSLADRLGQGGRQAVETYFNWGRVVDDMRNIADGILDQEKNAAKSSHR